MPKKVAKAKKAKKSNQHPRDQHKNLLVLFGVFMLIVAVFLVVCSQSCPSINATDEIDVIEDY